MCSIFLFYFIEFFLPLFFNSFCSYVSALLFMLIDGHETISCAEELALFITIVHRNIRRMKCQRLKSTSMDSYAIPMSWYASKSSIILFIIQFLCDFRSFRCIFSHNNSCCSVIFVLFSEFNIICWLICFIYFLLTERNCFFLCSMRNCH